MATEPVRIDLGCGHAKRDGFVGLDLVDGPHVDHVLDLTKDRYPFEDDSVDEVFSAHFLEHIARPNEVFSEIGRICKDGARIEFWTPYAFGTLAFLYGHLQHLAEEQWLQICISDRDIFLPMLGGRWLLHRIIYVVLPDTAGELQAYGVPMDFAIKYLKGVVFEFGVEIEFRRDVDVPAVVPTRWWSTTRDGARRELEGEARRLSTLAAARRLSDRVRAKLRAVLGSSS